MLQRQLVTSCIPTTAFARKRMSQCASSTSPFGLHRLYLCSSTFVANLKKTIKKESSCRGAPLATVLSHLRLSSTNLEVLSSTISWCSFHPCTSHSTCWRIGAGAGQGGKENSTHVLKQCQITGLLKVPILGISKSNNANLYMQF